jgi:lactose/L-arabinose transport system ATP-binding protein
MTVYRNMAFGLKLAKTDKAALDKRVREAASILQLDNLLDRRPAELSGGQRQRVAIGRAIVRQPKVFLFDEPLSNLDAALRVQTRLEIAKLHQKLQSTIIYVTHDQIEAMTLADKIVVLRAGKIEQIGSPAELYDDPDNTFVAGFIGSPKMNFLKGTWQNGEIDIAGHRLPAPGLQDAPPPDQTIQLGIRPEHLRPAQDGELSLPFTVSFSEFLGGVTYVYGDIAKGLPCVMEVDRALDVNRGTTLQITAVCDDMRCFDLEGQRLR